jgi:glycogen synthase
MADGCVVVRVVPGSKLHWPKPSTAHTMRQSLKIGRPEAAALDRDPGPLGVSWQRYGITRAMRILVITHLYPPHHAGTYDLRCQAVVEGLRLRGHAVRVLTSHHGLGSEQRDAEIDRCLRLNGVYGHPVVQGIRELQALETHNNDQLRRCVGETQPELVYVWSLHGLSKSLALTLRQLRHPVVYDVADRWMADELRTDPWLRFWNRPGAQLARTGLELAGQRKRLDSVAPTRLITGLDRFPDLYGAPDVVARVAPGSITAFRFDRLYFCSRALKQWCEEAGMAVGHGDIIYPGVSTDVFYGEVKPRSAPVKRLLVATALQPSSGVMTALRGLQAARQAGVNVTLQICGRGESEYVSQIRSQVIQFQLPVEFISVSNTNRDLADVYRQHDAFLYTAEVAEPFALTVLQAMACGLPVIGSTIGGAEELMRHGENAFVFSPGNTTELASRIQELHVQPALRQQVAETAQAEVQARFNETVVMDQIEGYLNATLEAWAFA